jgi:hypothetical protein
MRRACVGALFVSSSCAFCGDAPFTWEPHPFEIDDLVALARVRQAAMRPVLRTHAGAVGIGTVE